MQKEVFEQEATIAICSQKFEFCEGLLKQVKTRDIMLLFPPTSTQACDSEGVVNVPGLCVACGLLFVTSDVVCVYTLACGHQYHALCFCQLGWD